MIYPLVFGYYYYYYIMILCSLGGGLSYRGATEQSILDEQGKFHENSIPILSVECLCSSGGPIHARVPIQAHP